jgi:hypothetical protein
MVKGNKAQLVGMDDWEKDQDVDALVRASAIKKDPKRHAAAKAHARKKAGEYQKRKDEATAALALGKK